MDVSSRQGHSCDHIYSLSLALSLSEYNTSAMAVKDDTSAPWMDRDWMQNVLRNVDNDPSLKITDYLVKDMGSKGDNYLSEMQRIAIKLQRQGNKESKEFLIAKRLPQGNEMQKTLTESSAFPNEIKTFSQVLPKFQEILQAAAPTTFKPFAARHIYSQDKFPYILIVSDLAPEGFRMSTRQRGLDLEHCLLVMRTLGRFHAASVALHNCDPKLVESFKENVNTEECSSDLVQNLSKSTITSIAKVVQLWSEDGASLAKKLLNVSETVCRRLRQQLSPEGNRLNVLSHGDMWVNNMLFKYNDNTGAVEDIRLVDFQLACYSSCAIDLQHFIHTSPRDEVRVAHTEDLLKEYHNELCSTLKLLGQADKVITFQELLDEYERKGAYGFLILLLLLPHIIADSGNAADMETVLSGGNQDEVSYNRVANEEFVRILKRLLPVFERKGYF